MKELWAMRSELNLLGTTLDMRNASWVSSSGGIGASADSFYEYALKGYLLFGVRDPPYATLLASRVGARSSQEKAALRFAACSDLRRCACR